MKGYNGCRNMCALFYLLMSLDVLQSLNVLAVKHVLFKRI